MELLFEKVQSLINLSKELKSQADKRGENYNIFEVLRLTTRETRLHSAVVANLLNPAGNHGLGTVPLNTFLRIVNVQGKLPLADVENATVEVEHCIGTINDDKTEGGNIDILVTIGDYTIVIENKIYAGDQPTQLFRYHNFCSDKPHTLLYLTLDGHEASNESTVSLNAGKDYFCVSYKKEITEWLTECISCAVAKPLVRETLQQYLSIILKLTFQDMDNNARNKLFSLMADYPEVVASVVNNQDDYRQHLIKQYFIDPFTEWCQNKGLKLYMDENFQSQAKGLFGVYRPEWKKMVAIEFAYNDRPSYGVWIWNSKDNSRADLFDSEKNESWPYGWAYLDQYPKWDITLLSKELKDGKIFEEVCQKFTSLIDKIENSPEKYSMV